MATYFIPNQTEGKLLEARGYVKEQYEGNSVFAPGLPSWHKNEEGFDVELSKQGKWSVGVAGRTEYWDMYQVSLLECLGFVEGIKAVHGCER